MKILIAPDKFKGSLTADQVGEAISRGIKASDPLAEVSVQPLADGGEGTIHVISKSLGLQTRSVSVLDPLFRPINAQYAFLKDCAYIEMSKASGLQLLTTDERNCLFTSSIGTGQLIQDAIANGAKDIFLLLGGSATNDAGIGIAQALGFRFLDALDNELSPIGENLIKISKIDQSNAIDTKGINIILLCDVSNPMYGLNGAAHVYAPQKGANHAAIAHLDLGLQNFAGVIRQNRHIEVATIAGGGAAGGVAAGLIGLVGAHIKPGIETVMKMLDFEQQVKDVDLIITGEGKLDQQSLEGKVVFGVSKLAIQNEKPLALIVGKNDLSLKDASVLNAFSLQSITEIAEDLPDAMANASRYLEHLGFLLTEKYRSEISKN